MLKTIDKFFIWLVGGAIVESSKLETQVERAADYELEKLLPYLDPVIQKIVRLEVIQIGAKVLMRIDPQLGTTDAEATVSRLLGALDEMERRPTVKVEFFPPS
jgi:hypothetical protein